MGVSEEPSAVHIIATNLFRMIDCTLNIYSWAFTLENVLFFFFLIGAREKEHWQLQSKMKFVLLLSLIGFCWAQYDPHTSDGRTAIVHLFEWRWVDIAKECERYLAPKGFGGVQVR